MVKVKPIIIGVSIVIIGILAGVCSIQSEEKRVRKQFDLLSEKVSKDPGESAFTMAHKIQSLGDLFAENCRLKTHLPSLSGSYTPEEISSYAARGRAQFSKLSLEFHDFDIDFPDDGRARVVLTAKLTGKTTLGESVHEAHEFECVLERIEGKWLFSEFEVVEVLKK